MAGGGVKPSGAKPSGGDSQPTASGNVAFPVGQPASTKEPAAISGKAQTQQPDQYALRDLRAQEDMAYWAMWMFFAAVATFFITSLGTILIWRQVRLTRQAVEDTSQATEAMREANKIAARAQRPWVSIDARVRRFRADAGLFELYYEVTFENVGDTAALHFGMTYITRFCVHAGPEITQTYEGWRDPNRLDIETPKALMPGERHVAPGTSSQFKKGIRWITNEHGEAREDRRAMWALVASCWYRSETDDEWHRTERTFVFGQRADDPFDEWYLPESLSGDWSGEDLAKRFAVSPSFAAQTT